MPLDRADKRDNIIFSRACQQVLEKNLWKRRARGHGGRIRTESAQGRGNGDRVHAADRGRL